MKIKILALCGSSRRDSLNQKLLDIAALGAVDAGAQVSLMRWPDFPLPIYDGDWEAEHGLPERARAQSIMRCWSLPRVSRRLSGAPEECP